MNGFKAGKMCISGVKTAMKPFEEISFEDLCVLVVCVVAFFKLLFGGVTISIMVVFFDWIDNPSDASKDLISGHHQIYCIIIYVVIMFLTIINTFMMLHSQMRCSFLKNPEPLVNYHTNSTVAVCTQFLVYFFYLIDMPRHDFFHLYAFLLAAIQTVDVACTCLVYILAWQTITQYKNSKKSQIHAAATVPLATQNV